MCSPLFSRLPDRQFPSLIGIPAIPGAQPKIIHTPRPFKMLNPLREKKTQVQFLNLLFTRLQNYYYQFFLVLLACYLIHLPFFYRNCHLIIDFFNMYMCEYRLFIYELIDVCPWTVICIMIIMWTRYVYIAEYFFRHLSWYFTMCLPAIIHKHSLSFAKNKPKAETN